MKVYTRTGDRGTTMFVGGERVAKNDLRIEVLGSIDELNTIIGCAMSFVDDVAIIPILTKMQHDLFTLGAEVASMSSRLSQKMPKILAEHIREIESAIDEIEPTLSMPQSFVLPNGTQASSFLHFARTATRRVERVIVTLSQQVDLRSEVLQYVNRLSDLLYILARHANKEFAMKEQQPIYKYLKEK